MPIAEKESFVEQRRKRDEHLANPVLSFSAPLRNDIFSLSF